MVALQQADSSSSNVGGQPVPGHLVLTALVVIILTAAISCASEPLTNATLFVVGLVALVLLTE